MSPRQSECERIPSADDSHYYIDAEKGLPDNTSNLPMIPRLARLGKRTSMHIDAFLFPSSHPHDGITPFSSTPELALSWPQGWKAPEATVTKVEAKTEEPPKPHISRWILFNLWFNMYRKFFTFVILLNLAGIIMAALGRFEYAETHLGALVLGNLLSAVLFRNEMFLRFLYTMFIYGLRSVCRPFPSRFLSRMLTRSLHSGHPFGSSLV